MDSPDILKKIEEKFPKMSKGHKRIAQYIREHFEDAAFMTAARLGKETGVSESTVVRFAMSIGYEGYPEFQEDLSRLVKGSLTTMQRIGLAYGRKSRDEMINAVLGADIKKISDTMEMVDAKAFESAVDAIMNAKRIYIVGLRSCAPLAGFLSFYLNIMFQNVQLLQTNSITEIFEQMIRIDEGDVLIGISFPRYSMRTLKAMEYANSRSATVISITDSVHSPMNLYSSCSLFARSDSISIVDSLVAPLSLMNALVVALCLKRKDEVVKDLKTLEEIWADYQVYGPDEINFLDKDTLDGNF